MKPKSVRIDPGLTPDEVAAVERGQALFERRVLGSLTGGRVGVAWEPGEPDVDGGRTVRLTLTDEEVVRSGEFHLRELDDPDDLYWKLRELWNGLLGERLRVQFERVAEALAATGGD